MNTSNLTSRRILRLRIFNRLFSGAIIGVALLVTLGHVFFPEPTVPDYPWVENLLPIPLLLAVVCLALAFRWETVGGGLSLGFFIIHLLFFWVVRGRFFPLSTLPPLLPIPIAALLFLVLGRSTRNQSLIENA